MGKLVAMNFCAQKPIQTIADDFSIGDIVINKPTSSTMQRILADLNKGIMLSPEMYDPINRLLKSDEDNASGDAQLLCELFSGEETTYRFATERSRKIERNTGTPFSSSSSIFIHIHYI